MNKRISIGIAARNEENHIQHALQGLRSQKLPRGYGSEILVAVNGSTDATEDMVRAQARENKRIRLIHSDPGKAHAMNALLKEARGSMIAFCDADVVMEHTAILKLWKALTKRKGLVAVSVKPRPLSPRGWVQEMDAALIKTAPGKNICGGFFMARKALLPFFPPDIITEDAWLSAVLGRKRYAILSNVNLRLPPVGTLTDFIEQRIRWRAGDAQLQEKKLTRQQGMFWDVGERMKRWKRLSLKEKMWHVLAVPLRVYARWKGRKAFEHNVFARGWHHPARTFIINRQYSAMR